MRANYRLQRLYVDIGLAAGEAFEADRNQFHYLAHVIRAEEGAELEAGTAQAFIGQKNVDFGVDRIVAITQDGRGYVWHDLNHCGEKAYDGTVVGEECPARPKHE